MPVTQTRVKDGIVPWLKMVEEATGGKVKFNLYASSALAKLKQQYDACKMGIIDIGELPTYPIAGRFELTKMLSVPGLGLRTTVQDSSLLWKMYKEIPAVQQEYKDVKVIYLTGLKSDGIFSRMAIRNLEELKGKLIRGAPGPQYDALKALGASPVNVAYTEIYEALQKKTLDGATSAREGPYDRKWYEVAKYGTIFDMGNVSFVGAMNWDVWNSLPADVQEVFERMGGLYMAKFEGGIVDSAIEKKMRLMEDKGFEWIYLSENEHARWMEKVRPVADTYAAEMDKKGLPGTKTLQFIKEEQKKIMPNK